MQAGKRDWDWRAGLGVVESGVGVGCVCVCVRVRVCVYGQCLSLLVCVRQMFHKRTNNNNNNVLGGQAGNQAARGVGNNARSTDCLTRYLSRVQKQQPSSTEEKGRVG